MLEQKVTRSVAKSNFSNIKGLNMLVGRVLLYRCYPLFDCCLNVAGAHGRSPERLSSEVQELVNKGYNPNWDKK